MLHASACKPSHNNANAIVSVPRETVVNLVNWAVGGDKLNGHAMRAEHIKRGTRC